MPASRASASSSFAAIGSSERFRRGHDERTAGRLEQQRVERRVGEEQAHEGVAGRYGRGEARRGAPPHQHDRPLDRGEECRLARPEVGDVPRRGEVEDHHRERLLVALLSRAQAAHGLVRRRIAREVVAAEALPRDDPAVAEGCRGRGQGIGRAGEGLPRRAPAARRAARRPGRPLAARGTGGRRVPVLARGSRRTARSRPSWWRADRRARRGRSCSAGRSCVQFVKA